MPHIKDESQRQRTTTKGDERASAILNAAEAQLTAGGYDSITIASLTGAVGLTRAAFYFYFANKAEVIATLVARTVSALHTSIDELRGSDDDRPMDTIRELLQRTKQMWLEHGPVMRAAVDLSPTVPEVDASWRSAADAVTVTTAHLLRGAGLPDTPRPDGAAALARALVLMSERSFYHASAGGAAELDDAAATAEIVWSLVFQGSKPGAGAA
ncbi:TetR/AcrR family transcriptional regulator [Nocardioides sp. BP30]|uniref:TetR/AcrR family transcriptional regulator n=1 Tax=Nocardioides sp. BP30 TaxID=3036374 RepID=UPI002468E58B|nr:TetR/AcrR family transcriptional regulator [Nocardioides sp. BP30]WGL52463.1 TetR/AcrR family transcriptional regulator [Nocardioides sp. BP30]